MSRMSKLHQELTEQAAELGFESIEQAEANGYRINYEDEVLEVLDVDNQKDEMNRAYEEAYSAFNAKKNAVLHNLMNMREVFNQNDCTKWANILTETIKFVRECKDW